MDLVLPERVPWYVAGPFMGLCVVALYALVNERLGVMGAYAHVARAVTRSGVDVWRVWFFAGILVGAFATTLLRGGFSPSFEYGALGRALPFTALVALLLVGGVIMGYGARWAGGCTSGHGISGVASRSAASLVASATFFGTAVAATIAVHLLTGGAI